NLLANSKLYPHWVFLACDESIHVFHLNPIKHRCSPSIQVLQLPSPPEELLEIDRPTINYIRIFYLASIEILIAADSIFYFFFPFLNIFSLEENPLTFIFKSTEFFFVPLTKLCLDTLHA
ncbi:hypothetical protein HMI56_005973, partial [Coelomomyces lativittatus]